MVSNFRHHLLSLSLLIGVAAPWAAHAQASISSVGSGSVEDRVTSLERISNAQAQLMQQLQQQMSDNQRDIDSLRGEIQQNTYQLNQVVERQKQIYQQIDSLSSNNSNASQSTAGAGDNAGAGAATASGTDSGAAAASGSAPVQSGDANSDYNAAVALILEKKQYDQAITALQAWVKRYPDSTYQPNANYWLGQLFYNKGKKDDAAYYYATVVKQYPKSPKAAEALLKVGVIMQEKNDTAKAKAVYQQVIKLYPDTESAKQAQKRLSGM
ncbi:Cell division coordinator CpoB [Pantoea ananatis]|uniref:cell division protein CpoB n=1 Tax=Pantoea ananas TaxID=553 RepID=UPI0021F6E69A|nr:cell division protein CpoB [Pantoea ananatis]MCW0316449.1 Cell division coordinator CpoB [Pantoea ananatis]MCW0334589.1 Cell division coordinator CpoB [Pantoea ananatis]MCW0382442.1 Cell division coordinator CpoB [Pantoea ananatis]MCW0407106.1 Cell division coordinator CpoB [Pantoea ananatis]MCW0427606.1 Cell division coordinator CpoB [Pantoea ananatis]